MAEKISLGIELETRQAQSALSSLEKSFGALKTVAAAAVAAFASKQVIDFLDAGIDAAIAQQQAMSQLGQQLKLTGEFSRGAMDEFGAFADQMEKTTKFGDDLIISQLAVAKSFGISNDSAKKLVTAATELSAATGDSLDSSVRKLGLTFSGVTGKLDEQIPAMRGLSKEALATGAAVDVVLKRFGGSAAAEINTFAGAITQAENAFGNFQEALGTIIIENPAVIEAIKVIRDVFAELEGAVNKNKGGISEVVSSAVKVIAVAVPTAVEVIGFFVRAMQGIVVVGNLAFDGLITIVEFFAKRWDDTFGNVIRGVLKLGEVTGAIGPEVRADFDKFTSGAIGNLEMLGDASTSATAETIDGFNKFNDGFAEFQGTVDKYAQRIFDADAKIVTSAKDAVAGRGKAFSGGQKAAPEYKYKLGSNAGPGVENANYVDMLEARLTNQNTWETVGANLATSFGNNLAGGKDGARQFIAGMGGAIADVFAPGAGGAVAQAIQLLGQDPEAFRAAIDGFVEGIPEIIDNIVANIPYLVETLASHSGEIITALVNSSPRITIALAKSMPLVAQALADEMSGGVNYQIGKMNAAIDSFVWDLGVGATSFKDSIKTGAENASKAFVQGVLDGAQQIIDALTPGGGGSIKDNVGGFMEDPVGTTEGELENVFGYGLTGNRSSQAGHDVTHALLARVAAILEQPVTVNATANVRDQAFADVSLRLSRQNARTGR